MEILSGVTIEYIDHVKKVPSFKIGETFPGPFQILCMCNVQKSEKRKKEKKNDEIIHWRSLSHMTKLLKRYIKLHSTNILALPKFILILYIKINEQEIT